MLDNVPYSKPTNIACLCYPLRKPGKFNKEQLQTERVDMTITIRQATKQDIPHIMDIIKLAFEEDASSEQIRICIEQETFWTYVAELENHVVGFIFGFITTSIEGKKRRELDLQAVHPNYQGQGIGKKLIERFLQDETEADCIRALIAVGNIRMEKALTRLGFSTDNQVCGLYVSSQSIPKIDVGACYSTPEKSNSTESHLIPVTTMTYNGIWLEGKITAHAINSALSSKKHENDIVGAVVPVSDEFATNALKSADFAFIKEYRRWSK